MWLVSTPIYSIPNPIRLVLPLISHIPSFSPHHFHLHPPSLILVHNSSIIAVHKGMLFRSISPYDNLKFTRNTAYTEHSTEYNVHRVQVSTTDYVSSCHSCDYELTPECGLNLLCSSLQDWLPPASSACALPGKVNSSHSYGWKLTNWWTEFEQLSNLLIDHLDIDYLQMKHFEVVLQYCTIRLSK